MDDLEEMEPQVLITVLENFVCNMVEEEIGEDRVKNGIEKSLVGFLVLVKTAAERLPGTKFLMVEPMSRPAVHWYTEGLTDFTRIYDEGLFGLQLANISIINRADLTSQIFGEDNVHLSESAGEQFLRAIIYFAEKIYEAQVLDLTKEAEKMDTEVVAVASGSTMVVVSGSAATKAVVPPLTLQEQIDKINRDTN